VVPARVIPWPNFGCIELIPWNSRVGSLDQPDYVVIDLDPQDVPFWRIIEAALAVRKILDKTGIKGFCKTSGKRGLHIHIPLCQKYRHEQAKMIGELIEVGNCLARLLWTHGWIADKAASTWARRGTLAGRR
jgi:bifunctional non-homologous end joining protein LigD